MAGPCWLQVPWPAGKTLVYRNLGSHTSLPQNPFFRDSIRSHSIGAPAAASRSPGPAKRLPATPTEHRASVSDVWCGSTGQSHQVSQRAESSSAGGRVQVSPHPPLLGISRRVRGTCKSSGPASISTPSSASHIPCQRQCLNVVLAHQSLAKQPSLAPHYPRMKVCIIHRPPPSTFFLFPTQLPKQLTRPPAGPRPQGPSGY